MSIYMVGGKIITAGGGICIPGISSYSTTFPATENPISEGGAWQNLGAPTNGFTKARSAGGKAYGTNVGSGYDDSYGHMHGWESYPNQWVQVTLGLVGGLTNDGFSREVEIHLRGNSDTTGGFKVYELDMGYLGSGASLVRWDGASGSFTPAAGSFSGGTQFADGDVIYASIVGNIITLKQNTNSLGTVDVSTDTGLQANGGAVYGSGNPGVGFFIRPGANNSDFFIKAFSAGTL